MHFPGVRTREWLSRSIATAALLASTHCDSDSGQPRDAASELDAQIRDAAQVSAHAGAGGRAEGGGRGAAGPGVDGAAVEQDAAPDREDAGMTVADAGSDAASTPACDAGPGAAAAGAAIDVRPGDTLAEALQAAGPGDRIVVHAGAYAHESISDCSFAEPVAIESAAGEAAPELAGLDLHGCSRLALRGLRFNDTLLLEGASFIALHGVTLDPGTSTEEAALHIQGQGGGGACHDISVEDSTLANGGRTVFILGRFAPAEQWNHDLRFARNEITCGSHVCFQLSGARDTVIEHNTLRSSASTGVLTAGATRIQIRQNRFQGTGETPAAAAQVASPGMEWDNYDGVENMISSAITVANNLMPGWRTGVQLDAARDVAIVFNTIPDGSGLRLNHRTPHDRSGNVILDGNSEIQLWNNILASISIADGESRPSFESHNLVVGAGGGGSELLTGDPGFADEVDYELSAQSPVLGAGLHNADTPDVDFDGRLRADPPDLGARERGAELPASCP